MKMVVITYSGGDPARVSTLLDEAGERLHAAVLSVEAFI